MLKIRLMRIGTNKRPFYRVVAVDERAKRTGAYIELLGTYNPLTHPHEIILKQDRIDHWVKQGAQLSDGFLRIIGKAPQRPPRKPKKERKEPSAPTESKQETVNSEESQVETTATAEPVAEQPSETPASETQVVETETVSEKINDAGDGKEESSSEAAVSNEQIEDAPGDTTHPSDGNEPAEPVSETNEEEKKDEGTA